MNRPVTTRSVLYAVAQRMGLVPDLNLAPDQASEILASMDDRLREGWESYDFLETSTIEERAFRDDYDSTLCYETTDVVWDACTRLYYSPIAAGVGGPLTNPEIWTSFLTVSPAWIPWWQTNKTPIGTAFNAYNLNPFENTRAVEIPFSVSTRGLEFSTSPNSSVIGSASTTVWVYFRIPYPGLGQALWNASITYARDDPVLANDGNTYISLVDDNMGSEPTASGDKWAVFMIPYILSRFVRATSFADTLVVNGQNEKSQLEEQKGYAYLASEYDKQRLQQGQQERFSVYHAGSLQR